MQMARGHSLQALLVERFCESVFMLPIQLVKKGSKQDTKTVDFDDSGSL